jgi:hypothetical protein
VLYWLGDMSPGHAATWDFLDRRIDGVMQFEKVKKAANDNPVLKPFLALPNWLAGRSARHRGCPEPTCRGCGRATGARVGRRPPGLTSAGPGG